MAAKEFSLYGLCVVCVAIVTYCFSLGKAGAIQVDNPSTMVHNPLVRWRNDRTPTMADCNNRTGLVWVFNGGKVKPRFCHNVEEGGYWATIVTPAPPREKWVENIAIAAEEEHYHDPYAVQ